MGRPGTEATVQQYVVAILYMNYILIHLNNYVNAMYSHLLTLLMLCTEPYVPYTIVISAVTHAGEGDGKTIIDFTMEGSE